MPTPSSSAGSAKETQPPSQLPPEAQLYQLGLGFMVTAALHEMLEAGIADKLDAGPKPVAELARATGLNEDALYRTLRALATLGVFTETQPRTFANTPVSEPMRHDSGPMRGMLAFITNPLHLRSFAHFHHSMTTGETIVEAGLGHKMIWDYFGANPDEARVFDDAMTSMSAAVMPAVLATYDFSGIGTLVDVAGGHGFVLTSILEKYPPMRGVLFDMERVCVGARERIKKIGMEGRVRVESGDFFQAVPQGDAIVMKHIIHDWADAEARKILETCHRALPAHGKLILMETVLQPGNAPDLGKWIDLEMLAFPGGRERTEAEFRALFASAGFKLTKVTPNQSPLAAIEAVKA
ncbi:MAG: class I SAM-dependent methyltransferase [Candidatus Koribacter versatilis]|uniref:Class I SAM-dependent methyltransferase n=1 Tax=Candidatus Korobacter versatilis TaxID=658062 RepID=A0A932A8L9_9BACT|nr:class I SAM-dependent methyltransferase [Candidatus Koribacter versatilis]